MKAFLRNFMIDYAATGARIKRLRLKNHLTQEQLSEMIGLSPKHISNIETSNAHPSIETLVALSNVLHTSMDFLLMNDIKQNQEELFLKELQDLLSDCTPDEKTELLEITRSIKSILRKNRSKK
ncbi:helix-turn-helix transcriptional regulator [Eisenbergiella tayi]|uniref:Helix-turn-helix transcriptional regulator n=2 Tax=Lachnospiraceae TaxID=186803 RepID=A0A6N7WHB5_9FIRM|nr:helix-turn-helix transcriptional regulator [Eisenbergiella porci]